MLHLRTRSRMAVLTMAVVLAGLAVAAPAAATPGSGTAAPRPITLAPLDATAPTIPADLTASAVSSRQVDLAWTAASDNVGVQGYQVFRDGSFLSGVGPVGSTSFSDTTVSPLSTYTYRIAAVDAAGTLSGQSDPATASTGGSDASAPSTPTALVAVALAPNQVAMNWAGSTDNVAVTSYTIFRGGTKLSVVSGAARSFVDRSTAATTSYSYSVRAGDAAGNNSPGSAVAAVTTPALTTTTTTFNPVADAYVNNASGQNKKNFGTATTLLVASAGDKKSFLKFDTTTLPAGTITGATLRAWATAADAVGFGAYASSTTNWAETSITYQNAPTYGTRISLSGAVSVNTYASATVSSAVTTRGLVTLVIANNVTSNGTYQSREATNTPQLVVTVVAAPLTDTTAPSAPAGLTATPAGDGRIDLSWIASTDNVGVQGYQVFRNGTYLSAVGPVGSTAFSDTGLATGTAYSYTVRAIDAAGLTSSQSGPANATTGGADATAPTPPTGVSATVLAWNQVRISWTASSDNVGVTAYTVFRGGTKVSVVSGSTLAFTDRTTVGSTGYGYTVTASDAAGNNSTPSSSAVATTPAEPTAFVTNPWPFATLFATEPLTAEATDPSGVASVSFLVDGNVVGSDTTAPYSFDWDTMSVADGVHTIAARKLANDNGTSLSDPTSVTVANALESPARVDLDFAAGRLTLDEWAVDGVYAMSAQLALPERYWSDTPTDPSTAGTNDYVAVWSQLSQAAQDEITTFLNQPLRGDAYIATDGTPGGGGAAPAFAPPSGITDPCTFKVFRFAGVGYLCVHQTTNFEITYTADGTNRIARDNVDLADVANGGNGVPDYVDTVESGLEAAYTVYTTDLTYRKDWNGKVPVSLHDMVGGAVKPDLIFCISGLGDNPRTIELDDHSNGPLYLAHHELFHVFEYRFTGCQTVGTALTDVEGFRWWAEASADWAAGYVARSPRPQEGGYNDDLQDFLGRPADPLNKFDGGLAGRQYGSFIFFEYLDEYLAANPGGPPVPNADLMHELWQQMKDVPQNPLDVIQAVVQGDNRSMTDLIPDFVLRNYLLDYDDSVNGGPSDVETMWRARLVPDTRTKADLFGVGPARPNRYLRQMADGVSRIGSVDISYGGAAYVELVPPATSNAGQLALTVDGGLQGRLHARVITVDYPVTNPANATICSDTPIPFDGSGHGSVTVRIATPCHFATLILSEPDVAGKSKVKAEWSAMFSADGRVIDDFTRTVASGWGTTTPTGYTYLEQLTGTGQSRGVDNGNGWATLPGSGNVHVNQRVTNALAPWNAASGFIETVRFKVSNVAYPQGSALVVAFGVLKSGVFSSDVHLSISTALGTGTVWMTDGANNAAQLKNNWTANVEYVLKWERRPGGVNRFKIWNSADPEPAAWLLSIAATSAIPDTLFLDLGQGETAAGTIWIDEITFDTFTGP